MWDARGQKTDLYSVGKLLLLMITGESHIPEGDRLEEF